MSKMASLKKSASDRKADKDGPYIAAPGEDEGIAIHLDHYHLKNLGAGDQLKSGHKVTITARGHVENSESHSGKDGERHSARLRLTHMSLDHEPADRGENRGKGS